MHEMSMQALADRMNRLEQQNRHLRWAVVALPVVGLLLGAATASNDGEGKTVTAEKFVLQDANGKTRAVLTNEKDGPHFMLFHETDKPAIHLAANGDKEPGPAIWLAHEEGRTQVAIRGLKKSGPALHLYGEDPTKQGLYLGRDPVNGVPYVVIRDDGKLIWGVGGSAVKK
ncbi:MAG: hypothetical protein L0Z62_43550 [Gemmataceae bacterium]|nr:hypothetical protein [Gemmataceae bacterium]